MMRASRSMQCLSCPFLSLKKARTKDEPTEYFLYYSSDYFSVSNSIHTASTSFGRESLHSRQLLREELDQANVSLSLMFSRSKATN